MKTSPPRSGSWLRLHAAPCARRSASVGFSLIELLSAVAIISILGGVLATNAPALLSSRASAGGATLISNVLHSARQQALSASLPVAVVFTARSGPDARQAVTLLKGTRQGGALHWEAASPWSPLSQGVTVVPLERSDTSSLYEQGNGLFDGSALSSFNGQPVSQYFYLVYRPDGSIDAPQIAPSLVISTKPDINDYVVVAQENTGRVKIVAQ